MSENNNDFTFDFEDYQGVEESSIPQGNPPTNRSASSGLPDPNKQVARPQNIPKKNYEVKAKGTGNPQRPVQPQRQQNNPNMQKMPIKQHQQLHRVTPEVMANYPNSFGNESTPNNQKPVKPPKQKKPLGKKGIIGIVAVLAVIIVAGVLVLGSMKQEPQVVDYNLSGVYAYDTLMNALNNYDALAVDKCVGTTDGDSYIAQEWAYVNGVQLREEYIRKVCGIVKFSYPMVDQLDTKGRVMTDKSGNPIQVQSTMNNGEAAIVTIPDYAKLAVTMKEESDYITKLFKSSKYSEADYEWYNEMADLMLQYILDKDEIPVKTVEIALPIGTNAEGKPCILDDSALDDALFGSEEFHECVASFAQVCMDWTGFKDEIYYEKEEQENPEYLEWVKLFNQYYEADNGVFNKYRSKWEPWYLRDENNNYVLDENGNKIVNYYSVKREDGTDWIEPSKTVIVDVEKVRQVEDPWVEETAILYNWIGTNYIKNNYDGIGDTVVRVGDGTIKKPAGIGTSIITKVLCTDGTYKDIRVSLVGYWTGQDAIDYAERFDTRNRGFTVESVVQLITFEIKIENLESTSITFKSELTLADKNTNLSSRTGTLYGFTEEVTLGAGESVIINDWASSTELSQKYVCWGKSFGRNYEMVFFDCLAGTGNIPPYSAYEQFSGKSNIEE